MTGETKSDITYVLYTFLNNQNGPPCRQKSVELINESRYIYVNSEDTFTGSIIQAKIYVTWHTFKAPV